MVRYKFTLLGNGRVKPYLIPEQQIFFISVCPALNVISSIFFTILYVLSHSTVDLVYIIPKFQYHFSRKAPMKHTLQTLTVHSNTSVTMTVRPPTVQDK